VQRALTDTAYIQAVREGGSPYGDGHSGPRIAEILATTELSDAMLLKTMPY
jgi:UDP-N-acetylglucosamine 2-epimerase